MKSCRLCLKVGVKMSKMNNKHKEFIESIIINNSIKEGYTYSVIEDQDVCYICAAYLSKTYIFLHMVMNAQKIYYDLMMHNQFTIETLQKIDRKEHKLDQMVLTSISIVLVNINKGTYQNNNKSINNLNERSCTDIYKKSKSLKFNTDTSSCLNSKIGCSDKINAENIGLSRENEKDQTTDPLDLDDSENIQPIKEKINPIKKKIKAIDNEATENKDLSSADEMKDDLIELKVTDVSEAESSSSRDSIKKRKDADYEPDSTSHSEDSDFDDYDDTGRRITIPRDYDRQYPRKCELCNYEVPVKREHYRHYVREHRDAKYPYELPKIYSCTICGALKSIHKIRQHELEHTLQLNIKCKFCPKTFRHTTALSSHVTLVHPKKLYTCDYCSKTFKSSNDIRRHLRTHTGEKPFKCHICGVGFAHSGNRQIHTRSKHQNIRYVPKKRSQAKKPRKNKKKDLTDTEIESSSDDKSKRKKRRRKLRMDSKIKKKTQNGTISTKMSRKRIKACHTKKKIESKDQHQRKRKKVSDEESNDETLFELKSKMVMKKNQLD